MWFLVKGAFWFSAVLVVLPIFNEAPETANGTTAGALPDIALYETIGAMATALDDVQAICERHPDVCETGGKALSALGLQARDGARIAYGYLDTTFGGAAAESTELAMPALAPVEPGQPTPPAALGQADPLATGTVAAPAEAAAGGAPLAITVPVPIPAPAGPDA